MALKYLIDTSVLHRLKNEEVMAKVRAITLNGEIARCSITDLEYLYSARNEEEWEGASHLLSRFFNIEIQPEHFVRAVQVQRILAQKSQRGRKIPDLIIAAVAEQLDLTVLHYDIDFDQIADVTGQRSEWIIPAGRIS
ncbi:MAG: PIN domain-containing protein [Actinobacteria bacterium]|uniref:Unannotated protein n=1 Tax=freshwater metagenome TaxID=449393 RepID=A0A6J6MMZ9_9ZZZZ|nr:PIN domain-containing protein [Actinomycetota bacterium]MSZ60512.1 PIN domain-containing protein [Actinomycetota bacterium]